ncbi:hypothetical protein BOTBODRAFT_126004 [Botryobasidium botryosum FD-172 SS1]|uniref:Cystathionine beta-lyase n=1 Tax=Botryobasidium botryosum (strain FD-172 SS1) TaxID=930990 RepID=A0A067MUC8_BOTB1|nr:hypothetical protein BOTBODRAFT_126004 [Botryobasidium botryosum FD-172 SS1]
MAASHSSSPFDLPTPLPDSPSRRRHAYHFSTQCATVENPSQKDQYGSSSVPIYQTATFKGVDGQYDYTRSGNPTRSHLEHHLAKISSAQHAFTVSSGMASLDVITRLLKPGDEVIAGDDLYGGTNRLLSYLKVHGGVIIHHVDTTNPSTILPLLNPGKTAMVLLESPTNPLLKIADIAQIASDVKQRTPEALVVVDNTMMSPYLQRPLEHGADLVYDSGTKYLSGHHDLMAGVIICNRNDIAKQIAFIINSVGNALTPFDSFLLLRGIKTLAIRMDRQQTSAMSVASYLHRLGFLVHYPGLADHPGREIHEKLANGPGAVLSFVTGDKAMSERIVGSTRLWGISVSFGAVNSLISMPCLMSHASIDAATRAARGLPEDLIRLCVGIEDPSDLIEDLELALLEAGAITAAPLADGGEHYIRTTASLPRAIAKLAEDVKNTGLGLRTTPRKQENREWFVSAPGKVILFGEHAVVYGVTAIAAAVDLRCYGLTSPRHDGKLSLKLPDLHNFEHTWDIKTDLPWDAVTPVLPGDVHPPTLDQKLVDAITHRALPPAARLENAQSRAATIAFLYLYMVLTHEDERPSFNFIARSSLPVGAGLGSSASYSSCVATALLLLHQRVSIPSLPPPSRGATPTDPAHVHVSHKGRRALPTEVADEVNRWAFIAEKVLHGNPSGVDNAVAVFGGALAFTRAGFGKKGGMEPIHGFKSLKFLLTDSKVPRDTKALVAGVAVRKENDPDVIEPALEAIQVISDEARRALSDLELSRESLLTGLTTMIHENHAHLVTLGVSHPVLEAIRAKTAAEPFGLATKLTGAGGGGCAVTLIPDDFSDSALRELLVGLEKDGYEPHVTTIGGSGLGILSPYDENNYPSGSDSEDASAPEKQPESLRKAFERQGVEELAPWAEGRGRWLYV